MSGVSTADVKKLRERTGAGIMDCRNALVETGGDFDKAANLLRERGVESAIKKTGREAKQGLIEPYIHAGGRVGVLVELNCETDFVARTEQFRALAHDIALQVAATNPPSVGGDGATAAADGAEEQELPLLDQPFIKDEKVTVGELVKQSIASLGENIVVRRFARFELGQGE
ncbi:MAG TPA: translation elongation factor Ts [Thermomicrobiales bacterium]|nr:translation elongation factor Ts [Thermomicrobiales bacterium]